MIQPEEELAIPPGMPLATAATAIEEAVAAEGLRVAQRSTLAEYPGCLHWHLKQGKGAGTLEVTLLQRRDGGRILFSIHANRDADWIPAAIERLVATLNARL